MGLETPEKLLLIGRQSFAGFSYWRLLRDVETIMCADWRSMMADDVSIGMAIVDYSWLIELSTKQYIEFLAELTKLPTLVLFDADHSVDREALMAVGIQAVWSVEELQFIDLRALLETISQQHKRLQSIERERQQASQLLSRINSQPGIEADYSTGVTKLLDKEWVQQSASMLKRARDENKQLQHIAYHDGLTGLVARDFFSQMVNTALVKAQRQQQRFAILMFDLDHFKSINDTFGHEIGDRLLQQVADRLTGLLRDEDVIARLGGDEFAVLLMDARTPAIAGLVANKVLRAIHEPSYCLDKYDMQVTASIGIACYPDAGDSYELLMQHADVALYRSKECGRNQYQFFSAETNRYLERKMALERELMQANNYDCMQLVFEPVWQQSLQQLYGLKIMLAWHNDNYGLVAADELMPLLNQLPVAIDFDLYALEQLLQFLSSSGEQLSQTICYMLPLSFLSFSKPSIAADLHEMLTRYAVSFEQVVFMIEGQAWFRPEVVAGERIRQLVEMGCRFCWVSAAATIENLDAMLSFPLMGVCIDMHSVSFNARVQKRVNALKTIAAMQSWHVYVSGVVAEEGLQAYTAAGIDHAVLQHLQQPLSLESVLQTTASK